MKKIVGWFLLMLFISAFCGCQLSGDTGQTPTKKDNMTGQISENTIQSTVEALTENISENTSENAVEDIFKNYDKFYETMYYRGNFDKCFTPKEFMDLSFTLEEKSLYPRLAVTKDYYIARTDFVYKNGESSCDYLLVNAHGDIFRNYGDNSWVTEKPLKIGDFCFIKLQGVPSRYELLDKNANLVSTLEFNGDRPVSLKYLCDLGDEYYLFYSVSDGWYNVRILHPTGEYYSVPGIKQPFLSCWSFSQSFKNGEAKVEKINDDLFCFSYYDSSLKITLTEYFNGLGEKVKYDPNN